MTKTLPTIPLASILAAAITLGGAAPAPQARILDLKHYSYVFGEERNLRVFLPPDYDSATGKRYPVIYFFHGWSERYNQPPRSRRGYDSGDQYGGDNIAAFVGQHDVIVVKWDGYNPRSPGENYPRPYNISPVETYRQFPLYFPELVSYIDSNFRTLADRNHRATAGLSMGGFMSFWVAGKYPHLVGSASNFMGSSEFYVGPNGFPSEYRHDEMYRNYEGVRTRIVLGSKDFIRWYHRRMNAIWDFTRSHHEHEEFDWDHGTPGMAKTLEFHLAAFRNPLPKPALWHHADVYPNFDVWGFSVTTNRDQPGFTLLENVSLGGFRSSVREWLPGGASLSNVTLHITTDSLYQPGKSYWITDTNLETGNFQSGRQKADAVGRLHFMVTGAPHEIGISAEQRPVLTISGWRVVGTPWAIAGKPVRLRINVLNKGSAAVNRAVAKVTSPNPQVEIRQKNLSFGKLAVGERAMSREDLMFLVHDPAREIVKLDVKIEDSRIPIEVPLYRDVPELSNFTVVDGGERTLWERAVKQVTKRLGTGNRDGVANPGETIAIGVPDQEAMRAVELFSNDDCVDLSLRRSDPWGSYDNVGATAKISMPLISASCPEGHEIPFFVRYQIPNKPDHILKEGVVHVRVQGRDQTPPQVRWAKFSGWNRLEAEVRDGGKVRSAHATLRNGDVILKAPLNDQGLDGDLVSGDGVFTGLLPNPAPGSYVLSISSDDEFGNSSEVQMPESVPLPLREAVVVQLAE
jgi:pimeloyl-ACP methyl ester carboxylesterase